MTPDALDLTSTMAIGSIVPFACASTMMSRRVATAVCTVGACDFRAQAAATASNAAPTILFTGNGLLSAGWPGRELFNLPIGSTRRKARSLRAPGHEKRGGSHQLRPRACSAVVVLLRQILSDVRLDLRARVPVVEARLNELLPRRDERRLRVQDVEEHRRAEVVPLLLHAEVFLTRRDIGLLHAHRLFGVPDRGDRRDDVLLSAQLLVLQRGLRVLQVDLLRRDVVFAAEAVEERIVEAQVERPRVRIRIVVESVDRARAAPADAVPRRDRRQIRRLRRTKSGVCGREAGLLLANCRAIEGLLKYLR